MKTMASLFLFFALALSTDVSAAQTKSSFGGISKSSSASGGVTKSSFGGASKTSTTSISDRSSLPTRMTPAVTTPKTSPFGGQTNAPITATHNNGFGGQTQTPQAATNARSGFGGQTTSATDRSSLPTRSWQPKPTVATQSPADIALSNRAKTSGTFYNNRQDAMGSFKQKYNTTYTYHYNVQPTVWPTHIPRTYRYNNSSYSITFNPSYGEYGYWYGSSWRHYDVFEDLVMLDVLMHQHDYYYTPPVTYSTPASYTTQTQTQSYDPNTGQTTTTTYTTPIATPVVVGPPPSLMSVMIVLGVIFGIVVVIAVIANASKGY